MKILIIGGTGFAGGFIAKEAFRRGHEVVSLSRDAPEESDGMEYRSGNVLDEGLLEGLVEGMDVVVLALSARGELSGRMEEVTERMMESVRKEGARLGVVGGAGSLRVSERGPRLLDTPEFPQEFLDEAHEMTRVLTLLEDEGSELDWFYVSPAANFGPLNPGERKEAYRVGAEVLLSDEEGESQLSGPDLGVAVLDEIEEPRHRRVRFSVAY